MSGNAEDNVFMDKCERGQLLSFVFIFPVKSSLSKERCFLKSCFFQFVEIHINNGFP